MFHPNKRSPAKILHVMVVDCNCLEVPGSSFLIIVCLFVCLCVCLFVYSV